MLFLGLTQWIIVGAQLWTWFYEIWQQSSSFTSIRDFFIRAKTAEGKCFLKLSLLMRISRDDPCFVAGTPLLQANFCKNIAKSLNYFVWEEGISIPRALSHVR